MHFFSSSSSSRSESEKEISRSPVTAPAAKEGREGGEKRDAPSLSLSLPFPAASPVMELSNLFTRLAELSGPWAKEFAV